MCRARPGPRCSNTAHKRHQGALRNLEVVESLIANAQAEGREPTAKLKQRHSLALLRVNAAQQVWWMTKGGEADLDQQIEELETRMRREFRNRRPRDADSTRRRQWARLNAQTQRLIKRRNEGIARRENSREDMRLVKGERRELRAQATARGGRISSNAHPLSTTNAQRMREGLDARGVVLREWEPADVTRAHTWQDTGAANQNYFRNPRVRPPSRGRDLDGTPISVGSPVEGVEPQSRIIRLNTPDGQVVEGRHDFHLTKNDEGTYVVSMRSTVATSWEDASPVDQTKQQVGHILSPRAKSGRASAKYVLGTATSKREAARILADAKRNFDAPAVTALMGRDVLTSRARRRSTALQTRGFAIWQRYADPAYGSEQIA